MTSEQAARLVLPAAFRESWRRAHQLWTGRDTQRLWRKDPGLWDLESADRLGWLDLERTCRLRSRGVWGDSAELSAWAAERFHTCVVLGMGGSSLGARVLADSFVGPGTLELRVVDSTDPAEILAARRQLDLERTVFLASSKSGTTLETSSLLSYFKSELEAASLEVHDHVALITDPGSPEMVSGVELFEGIPEVGGRFSVLSPFGLVPARLCGFPEAELVAGARDMARQCRLDDSTNEGVNPGVELGRFLVASHLSGRFALHVLLPDRLRSFGQWLEQLLAESTGKEGKGLLPVLTSSLPSQEATRISSVVALESGGEETIGDLASRAADHELPLLRLPVGALGAELFRWMFATAVAGRGLGVNPFDQPDVDAAKSAARDVAATTFGEGEGTWQPPESVEGIAAQAVTRDGSGARRACEGHRAMDAWREALAGVSYVALLAYLPESQVQSDVDGVAEALGTMGLPITTGFGPRYLHSTGQLHKGGPDGGAFLVMTGDTSTDLSPRRDGGLSFQQIELSQALGDFRVLAERGSPTLHVHLEGDLSVGLECLKALLRRPRS